MQTKLASAEERCAVHTCLVEPTALPYWYDPNYQLGIANFSARRIWSRVFSVYGDRLGRETPSAKMIMEVGNAALLSLSSVVICGESTWERFGSPTLLLKAESFGRVHTWSVLLGLIPKGLINFVWCAIHWSTELPMCDMAHQVSEAACVQATVPGDHLTCIGDPRNAKRTVSHVRRTADKKTPSSSWHADEPHLAH